MYVAACLFHSGVICQLEIANGNDVRADSGCHLGLRAC
jgi:hypothetical protein